MKSFNSNNIKRLSFYCQLGVFTDPSLTSLTFQLFYILAFPTDLLHGLECSPSVYNNDKLRMQIADCKRNILDWLNIKYISIIHAYMTCEDV